MTWDSLNFQPEFTATASNIGYGWWSHDIGGHFHGERNEEMLIRWVQLGTFSPILRLHSSNNIFNIKEPWNLAMPYRQVMTKYLQLRHRLVPYLYTMNARAAIEGIPLVRPMYWGYPDSEEAYNVPNQYMFGSELIIAPITTPSDPNSHRSEVFAWLPPGRYVDLSTGMVYDGDRRLRLSRAVNKYPIFAREGAIVPFDLSPVLRNGCENPTVLELMVVVGADGKFELLEDDGKGQSVDQIKFRRTPISFYQESNELIIGPTSGEDQASTREWNVQFIGYQRHEKAQVSIVTSLNESRTVESQGNGRSLAVELGSFASNVKITVRLEKDPVLDVQETAPQIVKFLRNAQMNMDLKDRIRRIVESSKPKLIQISELHALALPSPLFNPIIEVLLADSRVFET
jgi:alpha-glucosidase (family GH31 glycosyl hydrolase)